VDVIKMMVAKGASVCVFDPVAMDEARHYLDDGVRFAEDEYGAIEDADALVIVTEWNQFRALDMERVKRLLKAPRIADLRNIYTPADIRALGFEYIGVGR